MLMPRPHPRPIKSQSLGMTPGQQHFLKFHKSGLRITALVCELHKDIDTSYSSVLCLIPPPPPPPPPFHLFQHNSTMS